MSGNTLSTLLHSKKADAELLWECTPIDLATHFKRWELYLRTTDADLRGT